MSLITTKTLENAHVWIDIISSYIITIITIIIKIKPKLTEINYDKSSIPQEAKSEIYVCKDNKKMQMKVLANLTCIYLQVISFTISKILFT